VSSRARQAVAPLYLFLCLILGGSAQGLWANMALQLLGLALIAWAALARTDAPLPAPARQLLLLVLLVMALVAIQMIPLPPAAWSHLGGRTALANGYAVLGIKTPWLPLSTMPYRTLDALLGLIPPLGLYCAMVRTSAYRPSWLVAGLLAGTIGGILLGALQVSSGNPDASPWYLYAESSFGVASGFFANANHMASLMVVTLPFLAALYASSRGGNRQRSSALLVLLAGVALIVFVGILLNRSLAAYGLTPPVLAASTLILLGERSRWRRWTLVVAGLLLIGAVAALATSSVRGSQFETDAPTSLQTRQEMLSTTTKALRDFMPWGSGLGSFRSVYQLYEDPARVTNTYVIHAHNDYVELALETGLPGILLIILFLGWWGRATWRAWFGESGPYARAASIASGAILVHSLVDFPLRTAAIGAVFAMCLALLSERRSPPVRTRSDLWPTRHVVVK
jgi:O-antigen ligase